MIGRAHHVILDCPDPVALAPFWSELLGLPVTWSEPDFVVVSVDDTTSGFAFQRVPDYHAPAWPDSTRPQQWHVDVMVDDLQTATSAVLALGAAPLRVGESDRVFADPVGHPFCLVRRPGWAPPVGG